MQKMVYTNKIDDEIIFHENNMLALYLEKAKKYMPFFEEIFFEGRAYVEILSERHYNTSKRKFPEWLPVLCVLRSSKRWK